MGEFGFITADGIYHVTVYATDEQGRFRILAMKNYPYESPPKTVEVMVQPKIPVTTTTTTRKPLPKHNFNTEACSGCFLTNGNNKPKGLDGTAGKTGKNDIRPLSKPLSSSGSDPVGPNSSNKPSSGNKFVAQKIENNFLHSNQKDTNLKALIAQSLALSELMKQANIAKAHSIPATTKTKDTKEYANNSQNPLKINNNSHTHTNAQKTNTLLAPKAPQISSHNVPAVPSAIPDELWCS
ncbi:hypothetical protein DOY81_013490 [Sarcophaga bullata]|nr:hypothetical protein DOY81_013490 [Sarcophaga bullata]